MAEHACLECLEVDGYVGKFRHGLFIIADVRTFRTLLVGWLAGATLIVLLALPAMTREARVVASAQPQTVERRTLSSPNDAGGLRAHRSTVAASIIIPVQGIRRDQLTDTFTQSRSGGRTHNAIDILAPRGTPVLAAVDGTIRKLFTSNAGGLTIYQFDVNEERVYYYAHLDHYDERIAEGLFVKQGTVIGYVGTTGNARETPHLHFAVELLPPSKEWWKGTAVNPYPILTSIPASAQ